MHRDGHLRCDLPEQKCRFVGGEIATDAVDRDDRDVDLLLAHWAQPAIVLRVSHIPNSDAADIEQKADRVRRGRGWCLVAGKGGGDPDVEMLMTLPQFDLEDLFVRPTPGD